MRPPATGSPTRRTPRIPGGRALLNVAIFALAIAAFLVLLAGRAPSPGIEVEVRDPPAGVDEIRAYLSGAVREPGVVTVAPGDRVVDAIALAGGARDDADLVAVNLARRVVDEDHVHIPRSGEASPLVDINTAGDAELQALPGIGPVRAGQIIDARAEQPFASTDELVERGILPASVYEQLRDLVTVPAAAAP